MDCLYIFTICKMLGLIAFEVTSTSAQSSLGSGDTTTTQVITSDASMTSDIFSTPQFSGFGTTTGFITDINTTATSTSSISSQIMESTTVFIDSDTTTNDFSGEESTTFIVGTEMSTFNETIETTFNSTAERTTFNGTAEISYLNTTAETATFNATSEITFNTTAGTTTVNATSAFNTTAGTTTFNATSEITFNTTAGTTTVNATSAFNTIAGTTTFNATSEPISFNRTAETTYFSTGSDFRSTTTEMATSTSETTTDRTILTSETSVQNTTSENAAVPSCKDTCQSECEKLPCECISEICTEVCPECGKNSQCVGLYCQCNEGYESLTNGTNCTDINECLSMCTDSDTETCMNTEGSYDCSCNDGYIPFNNDCIEVTEDCGDCGSNAGCFSSSADCECFAGYTGDPNTACVDIDECTDPTACSDTESCVNAQGYYTCSCISGYTKVTSTDECEPIFCANITVPCSVKQELCDSADSSLTAVQFPLTLGGYSATSTTKCGETTTNAGIPLGSRLCTLYGQWSTVTWLSSCGDGLSTVASAPIESEEERQDVSASLEVLTSEPEELSSDEVTSATEAIANVTGSASNISATTATSVVATISNVMESPNVAESNQTAELLMQMDTVASLVVLENGEPYKAVSNNVSMLVIESDSSVSRIGVTMLVRPNSTELGFRSDQFEAGTGTAAAGSLTNGQRVQASIGIPTTALKEKSRTSFYVFGNANLFQSSSNTTMSATTGSVSRMVTVSDIILSAAVVEQEISDLPDSDRLIYSLLTSNDSSDQTRSCGFWDEKVEEWKNVGCYVNESASMSIILSCECDHLTNFAALFNPTVADNEALNIITIVGCSISSAALVLIVLIFIFVPKTRRGRKYQASYVLLNLSLALLGLNVTLLMSEMNFIKNPESADDIKSSCIAIAAFLHFFLLASCAWMNCEGALLLLNVMAPLYTRTRLSDNQVILATLPWGWLMPAIFVGIVAAVNTSIYQYPYNDDSATVTCWIAPHYISYLVVIPAGIMLGTNLIVYIILTYSLCKSRESELGRTWRKTKDSQKHKLIINSTILVVLGLTWIFGFFLAGVKNEAAVLAFAYLFAIFNSLQGLFLFLLYVLRNQETRVMIRREINAASQKLGFGGDDTGRKRRRSSAGFHDITTNQFPRTEDTLDTVEGVSRPSSLRRRSENESRHIVNNPDTLRNWRTNEE